MIIYEQKSYTQIEVIDILQSRFLSDLFHKHCKTMAESMACCLFLQEALKKDLMTNQEVQELIKKEEWKKSSNKSFTKELRNLKKECSCDSYSLLHTNGCNCGHIIPYKPKNIFA